MVTRTGAPPGASGWGVARTYTDHRGTFTYTIYFDRFFTRASYAFSGAWYARKSLRAIRYAFMEEWIIGVVEAYEADSKHGYAHDGCTRQIRSHIA